jgi:hypothetical protein
MVSNEYLGIRFLFKFILPRFKEWKVRQICRVFGGKFKKSLKFKQRI